MSSSVEERGARTQEIGRVRQFVTKPFFSQFVSLSMYCNVAAIPYKYGPAPTMHVCVCDVSGYMTCFDVGRYSPSMFHRLQ